MINQRQGQRGQAVINSWPLMVMSFIMIELHEWARMSFELLECEAGLQISISVLKRGS